MKCHRSFYISKTAAPLIFSFSRGKGCSNDMANDILQETMVMLTAQMANFVYAPTKGKFRNFLLRIVECRIKDAYRREKRYCTLGTDTKSAGIMENIEDSRVETPGKSWEDLWEQNLLIQACRIIEQKINPRTYRCFELYVFEQKKADEVAEILGIDKNLVFQHKNRVTRLLKAEIAKLKEEFGEAN